ncbi:MAG: hypothetical protein K2K97_10020, partial [Muribaculaceae bacterium]|nr:hypothetical protein [Muribaculaceae bacterium]
LKDNLSVRAVEEMARQMSAGEEAKTPAKVKKEKSEEIKTLEKDFSHYFSVPVKVDRAANGKGSVSFKFSSDDELYQLIRLFEKIKGSN